MDWPPLPVSYSFEQMTQFRFLRSTDADGFADQMSLVGLAQCIAYAVFMRAQDLCWMTHRIHHGYNLHSSNNLQALLA
jgi:hypothetical protein